MSAAEAASQKKPDAPSAALSPGALAQLVGINVLWGASSVAAKAGLAVFGPFTLTALRFLPAGLLLLALARASGPLPRIRREDRTAFLALSLFGIVLSYGIQYAGIQRTTASDASLLVACEPILIALFARVFLKERLNTRQWGGMLLGLAGIWLIAGQAVGNRIALLGLLFESSVSVLAKRLSGRYPGLFVVAVEMLTGALMLAPLAIAECWRAAPVVTPAGVGGLLYLSLICSALCYGVWYRLLPRFPVSVLGVSILFQPLLGPFYGWLFRGEILRPVSALGGALVLVGIALTTLTGRRAEAPPDLTGV